MWRVATARLQSELEMGCTPYGVLLTVIAVLGAFFTAKRQGARTRLVLLQIEVCKLWRRGLNSTLASVQKGGLSEMISAKLTAVKVRRHLGT
jgi:hypothetical protein